MESILLVMAVGILNLLSFYMGLHSNRNKEIKNPVKQYQEYKESRENNEEYEKMQKILETNLENIENYDGTSLGQKDFD